MRNGVQLRACVPAFRSSGSRRGSPLRALRAPLHAMRDAIAGDDPVRRVGKELRPLLRCLGDAPCRASFPGVRSPRGATHRASRQRSTMATHCANVDGSATVGPEPIAAGDRRSHRRSRACRTSVHFARCRKRPPVTAERCLRTALISSISAPPFTSSRFADCTSANDKPAAGSTSNAEAPPVNTKNIVSPAAAASTACISCCVPARPAASGTG